jgi:hypothetical protein
MKTLLFKPFERYSETVLLVVGLMMLGIGILLGTYLNARFDGALDLHFSDALSIRQTSIDLLMDLLTLFLFLFIAAKLVNRKTRVVDIFSVVIIARIPFYFATLINMTGFFSRIGKHFEDPAMLQTGELGLTPFEISALVICALVILLLVIWSVALLYNGYKIASNAKSASSIVFFIIALLLAEIASKILIHFFNHSSF